MYVCTIFRYLRTRSQRHSCQFSVAEGASSGGDAGAPQVDPVIVLRITFDLPRNLLQCHIPISDDEYVRTAPHV